MLLEFLGSVWSIVQIILGLGLVIFIHELGHFLVAKKCKVRIEVFSLGFGPAIWKRKWGETEYRVSWIPLGGYVKMAGESFAEERTGKPDELTSKSAWQRFQIFVAGALMNLVIAFPIAIAAFLAGRYEMSSEIGVPGIPETLAGMKPGDVILEVDGRPIASGDEYRIEMVRQPKGKRVPVRIRRGAEEILLEVEQRGSEGHRTLPYVTRIGIVVPDSPLAKAGIMTGDEVVGLDGQPVFTGTQVMEVLRDKAGKIVEFTVRRRKDEGAIFETLTVAVTVPAQSVRRITDEYRLIEPIVGRTERGFPAHGKFEKDDHIKKIGSRDVKSWQDLVEAVEPSVGKSLEFHVLRKGEMKVVEVQPTYGDRGKGQIGLAWKDTKILADVREGTFLHEQGLRSGDALYSIDGQGGEIGVKNLLMAQFAEGKTSLVLQIDREGQRQSVTITPPLKEECDFRGLGIGYDKKGPVWEFSRVFHRHTFGGAIKNGLYEPYRIAELTVTLLYKLFAAEEPVSGLAGPVGIFQVSYRSAELSSGNFLWLLCLITVNLGIFNLLPIPILDGGHVVLLAVEKLRGKPPSEKFIAIFQYAGLVFLLALIIFVTYNDINRIVGG